MVFGPVRAPAVKPAVTAFIDALAETSGPLAG